MSTTRRIITSSNSSTIYIFILTIKTILIKIKLSIISPKTNNIIFANLLTKYLRITIRIYYKSSMSADDSFISSSRNSFSRRGIKISFNSFTFIKNLFYICRSSNSFPELIIIGSFFSIFRSICKKRRL